MSRRKGGQRLIRKLFAPVYRLDCASGSLFVEQIYNGVERRQRIELRKIRKFNFFGSIHGEDIEYRGDI